MLRIENLYKSFGAIRALDGVSIKVEQGSITGLIGPNGSGKTTLFNVVSGFYRKDSGRIYLNQERIDGLEPFEIVERGLRRTFQISKAPGKLTVLENLMLAPNNQLGEYIINNFLRYPKVISQERNNLEKALSIASIVRLTKLKNEFAGNLSGGQQKLLSLGRILMAEPKIILLDEPTAGVNPTLTLDLLEVIEDARKKLETTFLIIEHNMKVINQVCDLVYVLDSGERIAKGTPEEIQEDKRVLDAYLSGAGNQTTGKNET